MVAGSVSPDPQASGPKQPRLKDQPAALLLCGLLPDLPYYLTSPHLAPRRPHRARAFWGQDRALRSGQGVTEGWGEKSPNARKAATCSSPMDPLYSHTYSPFPPSGHGPAGGPILVASEHLPDTWGDATPALLRPSGPPGTSHCPRTPGQAAAFSIPLGLLRGARWPAPHGGSTLDSTQATGTD